MGESREPNFLENAGHFAEEIDRLAIGFSKFDPQCLKCQHRPLGEPATPFGVGGFVGVSDNCFSFRYRITGEETEFRSHNTPSLRFLPR